MEESTKKALETIIETIKSENGLTNYDLLEGTGSLDVYAKILKNEDVDSLKEKGLIVEECREYRVTYSGMEFYLKEIKNCKVFHVGVREVQVVTYVVYAEDYSGAIEEAKTMLEDGSVEPLMTEYSHTLDTDLWSVENENGDIVDEDDE